MSVETIVQQQYRSIVDNAAASLAGLKPPPEGWLRTVRNALGMSGAELAKKMGVTRARVTQAEHAELTGGITLKSMQATAEAMGCRFVYAIIPSSEHKLPDDKIAWEVERLTREIAQEMPPDFWRDK